MHLKCQINLTKFD